MFSKIHTYIGIVENTVHRIFNLFTVKEYISVFCIRSGPGILRIILIYLFKTEHSCVCYALESIMYNYK